MPKVIFIQTDGRSQSVEIKAGDTVMDAALDHNIAGIKAQCGGGVTCSTCHCYVEEAWIDLLPEPISDERDMLAYVWKPHKTSRLCCQLVVTNKLDGIVIFIPEKQV